MFNISGEDAPNSKFYVSHGTLPHYVDPRQPPSKKKPFATVLNQPFNHTVGGHTYLECIKKYLSLILGSSNFTRGVV
jgi:hypothetical protein